MSESVENRVVSMTFDNTSFEKNAQGTLTTLDKLKQSLDFGGTGKKSIEDLSAAAGRFDMAPMGVQVEGVSAKFLALSAVAITALTGIATKAFSVGTDIIKSLTIAPIADGYKEFETNIGSIQTILANTSSKGTNLEQVNQALDELNQFSDKTIYNFSEMTKNIGTFTAAGVSLETSTKSIKGIANLAALSGSNSEQASTAMYQLSQAIASGTVKLMDWNSVQNAGMGGEVFQKALFNTGVQMGKIADAPIGTTFEQWTKAGNSFRGSLEQGWLTADVLTGTLDQFTGDMTDAELASQGFTKQQISDIQKMAVTANDAATKVKTATQLVQTVKEAIGSGWSTTFRTLVGNFEQSKTLFTDLSNFIGGFVSASADARNELLNGWAFLGGRDVLLEGLKNALTGLLSVVRPITQAFRDVFPRTTVLQLAEMTKRFEAFTQKLIIGSDTADKIRSVFRGFFAILDIGWEIVKGITSLFTGFIGSLGGVGGGFLSLAANAGDVVSKLRDILVTGGAIQGFFAGIGAVINKIVPIIWGFASAIGGAVGDGFSELTDRFGPAIEKIQEFGKAILDFFGGAGAAAGNAGSSALGAAVSGIGTGFDKVGDIIDAIINKIKDLGDFLAPVGDALKKLGGYVGDFMHELGEQIGNIFSSASFDDALKVVNTGLLGGIALLIRKFVKDGLKLDFGQSGLFESITKSFDALTGTLKSFQAQIKAEALFKIAKAIAVLVAALLVLSLMDTEDLVRSLSAMAVGMGQLVGALALLNQIGSGSGGAKLVALSGSLVILSGAVLVLSLAMKVLSSMSMEELGKGLLGVAGTLLIFAGVAKIMDGADVSFIKLAFGLGIISGSLVLFSLAIRAMGSIDTDTMIKGMIGIAAALGLFVGATLLLDEKSSTKLAGGMFLFALSLRVLSQVISTFGGMDLKSMIQGFVGLAATMGIIIFALKNMPKNKELLSAAAGMLLMAGAIFILSKAAESLGQMSLGDLIKGLLGLTAILALVVVAANAMTGAAAGAVSMIVMAAALEIMLQVLKGFGSLGIDELLIGLAGIAGVLLILGAAAVLMAPIVPALIALGVALGVVGIAFALFGAGAYLIASAFEKIAGASEAGVDAVIYVLKRLAAALPEIMGSFATSLVALAQGLLDQAPKLLDALKTLLLKLLDVVIEIIPKIGEVFGELVSTGLKYIREKFPEVVATGLALLLTLLTAIKQNIGRITEIVGDIIANFINALAENTEKIIDAGVNLVLAFIQGLGQAYADILAAGVEILVTLLEGIASAIHLVLQAATDIITSFIDGIADMATDIAKAGADAFIAFITGIAGKVLEIAAVVTTIITTFIEEMGKNAQKIIDVGTKVLVDFLSGLTGNIKKVTDAVVSLLIGLAFIMLQESFRMIDAGIAVAKAFLGGMVDRAVGFVDFAGALILELLKGMTAAIKKYDDQIADAAQGLGKAIIDALVKVFGLQSVLKGLKDAVFGLGGKVIGWFAEKLGIKSPSKEFMKLGKEIPAGLAMAINQDTTAIHAVENMGGRILSAFEATIKDIPNKISAMDELNPTITPILDLSAVQNGAKGLSGLFPATPVAASASFSQAREIATTSDTKNEVEVSTAPQPTEIKFEQNIYSPTALSTSDIYRNTRSQIALAKEDLNIP